MHPRILHNGKIHASSDRVLSPGQVGVMNGWGVFSTLRVTEGMPFAFERHWQRMSRDAKRMRVPMPDSADALLEQLQSLIAANQAYNATLRVAIIRNLGGAFDGIGIDRPFDTIAFTKDLSDWGKGARLGVKPNARHGKTEFAGAKITSWANNLCWYEEARQQGLDEVVLLDEQGQVSECTSANLFAVFGDQVVTPPLETGCLAGITREILLEAIQIPGLAIHEKLFRLKDLEAADEIFITSSTMDIHPVLEVLGLQVKSRVTVTEIIADAFAAYQSQYFSGKKPKEAIPAK